jgi:hypothetical protein
VSSRVIVPFYLHPSSNIEDVPAKSLIFLRSH